MPEVIYQLNSYLGNSIMSYIHKALRRAQNEKDSLYQKYGEAMTKQTRGNFFPNNRVLLSSLFAVMIIIGIIYFFGFNNINGKITEKKNKDQSLSITEKNKPIKKNNIKKIYDKARALQKRGHLHDAKQLYQDALKLDPGYPDVLNNLGVIYIYEKNYTAAQISFEKAIRLKPEAVNPYYNLACIYAAKGDIKQAIDYLKKAYSLDENVKIWARTDIDLEILRKEPDFKKIIKR